MKFPKLTNLDRRKLKYVRWAGYVLAYLLAFVVFAYVSFPYERLRQYVVSTYNTSQPAPADRLEIDSLTWSWRFPGIVAEGVRLVVNPPSVPEGTKPPPPQYLEAEEVFVSASALALLTGAREASFGARALDGEVAGWARDSAAGRHLDLQLDGVNPGKIPQLANTIGLPLGGSLSGHASVEVPEGNVTRAEGTLELTAEDLVLGDGKAKIQNTIALPELHMGAFNLKAQISGGRLKIDECTAQGRDLDLALTGSIRLRPKVESSVADLELKFSFAEKYRNQSDMTKALFGQPEVKIPGLFDTVTSSHLSKQEDGSYAARLSGTLSRMQPRPLTGGRRSSSASSAKDGSTSSGLKGRRVRKGRGARSSAEEPAAEPAAEDSAEDSP
jgi:type II secretion system protein N